MVGLGRASTLTMTGSGVGSRMILGLLAEKHMHKTDLGYSLLPQQWVPAIYI